MAAASTPLVGVVYGVALVALVGLGVFFQFGGFPCHDKGSVLDLPSRLKSIAGWMEKTTLPGANQPDVDRMLGEIFQ